MKRVKILLLLVFALTIASSCEKEDVDIDGPKWLEQKIADLSSNKDHFGSTVYSHVWKGNVFYHIQIPISSCAYCEVYDKNGNKLDWAVYDFESYLAERKNEKVVWTWPRD